MGGWGGWRRERERTWGRELIAGHQGQAGGREAQHPASLYPAPALQRLRGTVDVAGELADLEEERTACQGRRALRPWELFQDRGLRRQVMNLTLLGSALELCGSDSVRPPPRPPSPRLGGGGRAAD